MNDRNNTRQSYLSADLGRFFIIGIVFLSLALFLRHKMSDSGLFQIQVIRDHLLGRNFPGGLCRSSAIFLLSSGLLISLGIPRLWICGVAGAIYGTGLGTLLALGGSMIGATTVYLMGRSLLAGMVQRRLTGRLAFWGQLVRQNGFWWVLYGRLFPFTNATINSLICGCCRVPLGQYLAGSFLGFIPLTFVFSTFGSGGINGNFRQILISLGLLGLTMICRQLTNKYPCVTTKNLNALSLSKSSSSN